MGTSKRKRVNPKKLRANDIVTATQDFTGRVTPPPPVSSKGVPNSYHIPAGSEGVVYGRAEGAPDLFDVEFYVEDHVYRVEAAPDQVVYAG